MRFFEQVEKLARGFEKVIIKKRIEKTPEPEPETPLKEQFRQSMATVVYLEEKLDILVRRKAQKLVKLEEELVVEIDELEKTMLERRIKSLNADLRRLRPEHDGITERLESLRIAYKHICQQEVRILEESEMDQLRDHALEAFAQISTIVEEYGDQNAQRPRTDYLLDTKQREEGKDKSL